MPGSPTTGRASSATSGSSTTSRPPACSTLPRSPSPAGPSASSPPPESTFGVDQASISAPIDAKRPVLGQDPPVTEEHATNAVVVEGAVLAEGGVRVLGPLDLVVGTDERWVVLGPNGCGKTSLLRLLSFQRAPHEGRVTILGNTYGRVDIRES